MNKQLKTNIVAIAVVAILVTSIFLCGYSIGKNKAADEIWYNNRTTQVITVHYGDTLWSIAQEYKPDNIDVREYIHDIKQLNNITSDIHGGDKILVYVY